MGAQVERAEATVGVVGIPGGWSTERLADAIERRTGARSVIDPAEMVLDLASGTVLSNGLELTSLDALVVKKISRSYGPRDLDRLEVLRYAAGRGVAVFSPPSSIARLVDRAACTVELARHRIPMPPTIITEDPTEAALAVTRFGAAVLKPLYTTKARGMLAVDADGDTERAVRGFQREGNPVIYVQKRVSHPGHDLGIVFLGGEHIGTYARVADDRSWNTTIREGGTYEAYEPTPLMLKIAERAQAPFRMDYTSVDVIESPDGPLVLEVSAFGGFRGLWEARSIDAARLYADYVLERIRGRR